MREIVNQLLPRGRTIRGNMSSSLAQRINKRWLQMDETSRVDSEPVGNRATPRLSFVIR